MQTIIVLLIVSVAAVFFIRNLIQTYKGQGCCTCGEGCCPEKTACGAIQIEDCRPDDHDK